jgi:hypothetical protein
MRCWETAYLSQSQEGSEGMAGRSGVACFGDGGAQSFPRPAPPRWLPAHDTTAQPFSRVAPSMPQQGTG